MKKVIFLTHTTHDQATNDMSSALVYWYGVLENLGYEVVYSDYREYDAESFYLSAKEYKPNFKPPDIKQGRKKSAATKSHGASRKKSSRK